MEMRIAKQLVAGSMALTMGLSACATNEQTGQLIGGVVGALAGKAVAGDDDDTVKAIAILGGAALGAWVGGKIGRGLDEKERQRLAMSTQQVLDAPVASNSTLRQPIAQQSPAARAEAPTDKWVSPTNPQTTTGSTTLMQVSSNGAQGGECRTVRQLVVKNGQEVSEDVKFCRQTASSGWQPAQA
jgi:surface antigen